ncbi:ClpXP protease specificity-enhancing factor [Marinimicrobium sp. C6131]|uniref:ClpXP protease specificity-enhancing factor n=1 Tax=Marinimicrobium sp. C6131 TaxID=3022676 RepID=UPI00223D8DC3|nr:ClpXP protease specificity-enhancing factor [Marinimicrobium sp. C6131]UZJ44838.1 ClpXP protease specificity-enhancing factor [Marinimicrobium sp. C6131]
MAMTSSRPYMIRALYEWIVDNGCTPYILVDAQGQGVEVPQQHVNKDGQIVLNINPTAVKDLFIGLEQISFNARFGGIPTDLVIPCASVLGIYARENGQGMVFEHEPNPEPPKPDSEAKKDAQKRPNLKVVK